MGHSHCEFVYVVPRAQAQIKMSLEEVSCGTVRLLEMERDSHNEYVKEDTSENQERSRKLAKKFLDEGWVTIISVPAAPVRNAESDVKKLSA